MADREDTERAFAAAVNMNARQLEAWLKTEESKSVGFKREGASESVGHASGRHIVSILRKAKSKRTDGDYAHMRKVVGFVRRHRAQRPHGDISRTRWRYSLMNWGNDPMIDEPI